ncbi:MAG: hypothetical protein C0603_12840 [Denitrovibrio sp.]|nr:MAG: hypothetical protein C0603_12840 [Denitrovibrio sp.]
MKLEKMNKKELYELAKKYAIKNRSKMGKPELLKALTKYEKTVTPKTTPQASPEATRVTSPMPESAPPAPEQAIKRDYPIPERYNIDTVVLLPVNPKKEYVYWEVSDKTITDYCAKLNIAQPVFILKVFQGDEDSIEELASVKVSKYGNWYFDLYCPEMNLWAELGILDSMGNYYPLMASKKIMMPSDTVSKEIDKETWMTVGENIEQIFDLSGLNDVRREELLSSARLHSELFKKLHSGEGLSSTTLHNKQGGE